MSPKSTIPVISPASSARALSVVRSPWTTWARSDGQTGTTTASNRSSTRPTRRALPGIADRPEQLDGCARRAGRPTASSAARPDGRSPARPARGAPSSRPSAPSAASRQLERRRPAGGRAARRTSGRGGRRRARSSHAPRRAGSDRRGRPRTRPGPAAGSASGSAGSTCVGVEDRERLHVERGRVLGGVRHLHDRQRRRRSASSSRNVWSRSLPRSRAARGVDAEGPPGDVEDVGGDRTPGVAAARTAVHGHRHGSRARMAPSSRTNRGPVRRMRGGPTPRSPSTT